MLLAKPILEYLHFTLFKKSKKKVGTSSLTNPLIRKFYLILIIY